MQQSLIIDLQGFKDYKNDFIVKEFAMAAENYTQMFLIKPPYAYTYLSFDEKRQVRWIERNRGILWKEGFIDIIEFKRLIQPFLDGKSVVVKGKEKINWVHDLCKTCEVVDIADKGCPNLNSLFKTYEKKELSNISEDVWYDYCGRKETYTRSSSINCMFHNNVCALKNVILLKKWLKDNDKLE